MIQSEVMYGGIGVGNGPMASALVRATPENPSFNLNDPEAWDAFDSCESSSGVSVNADSALEHSPWWRGLNLISGKVGITPTVVYKRVDKGKERATDHDAFSILRYKANPYQNAMVFKQQLTGHVLSYGNGYGYIEYQAGKPKWIWPLDPTTTYPVREVKSGRIWIVIENSGEPVAKVDPSVILHIKGLSFDGLVGYKVIDYARDSLGLGIAQRRYAEVLYKNGSQPRIVLEAPQAVTEAQVKAVAKMWNELHQGVDNFHKTAVLSQGLKAHPLAFSNVDSQFMEATAHNIREVANWLGLPPHKLGDTTRTAYASLEQENQACLDDCYNYWFCAWEYECRDKLLSEDEKNGDTHVVEFLRQSLVSTDMKTRGMYLRLATGGRAWMTPDEARAIETMNTVGGDADKLIDPTNNFAGDGGQEGGNESGSTGEATGDTDEAARQILAEAERRAMKRLSVHAVKAAKYPAKFIRWLDSMEAEHGVAVRQIMKSPADLAEALGIIEDAGEYSANLIGSVRMELLTLSGEATPGKLSGMVEAWAKKQAGDE